MSGKGEFENWKKDLEAFLHSENAEPPRAISESVLSHVHASLNPNPMRLLPKLLAIYTVTGLASLFVCPQLGIGPVGGGHGIMSLVMGLGSWACASFCGGFFMGTSTAISLFVLRPEEAKVVLRSSLWQYPVLLAFLFSVLMALGVSKGIVSPFSDLPYLALWAGSALVASFLVYRTGYRLRWHLAGSER